ncbi:MAG: hypothetical protein P1V51_02580 [Deltaproteobacteria bacterium]|nr:hypothetical protein [Deltaproteobacteria bacterium]
MTRLSSLLALPGRLLLGAILLLPITGCEIFLEPAGGLGESCVMHQFCRDDLVCIGDICSELTFEFSEDFEGHSSMATLTDWEGAIGGNNGFAIDETTFSGDRVLAANEIGWSDQNLDYTGGVSSLWHDYEFRAEIAREDRGSQPGTAALQILKNGSAMGHYSVMGMESEYRIYRSFESGDWSILAKVSGWRLTSGVWYEAKFRNVVEPDQTLLDAVVWERGTPEPQYGCTSTPTDAFVCISAVDDTAERLTAGSIAFQANQGDQFKYFDDARVLMNP